MTRKTMTITAVIAAVVVAAGAVTGIVLTNHTATPASAATSTATTATPTAPTVTTSQAPAPTPTTTTVAVPAPGATVPADQVAAVRKAGGHVYVSPNGTGDGLVVAAGQPLPQVVVADWKATGAGQVGTSTATETARSKAIDAMEHALMDLNVPVVSVTQQGAFNGGKLLYRFWSYGIVGVPDYYTINGTIGRQPTLAVALAGAQKLAAQYGAQVLDEG